MEFFIILKGSCGVFYRNEMKDEHKFAPFLKKIKKEKLRPVIEEGKKRIKSSYQGIPEFSKLANTKIENRSKSGFVVYHKDRIMNKVVSLTDGKTFGGMSLQKNNKSGRRMATVVAEIDTRCLVLDRDSYLVSLFSLFLQVANSMDRTFWVKSETRKSLEKLQFTNPILYFQEVLKVSTRF